MLSLPRRRAFARRLALAAPALILACSISSTVALLNDNTVKGAATNHIFSSSFGDSIDTLSGQLTFNLPIGPSFAVSESLHYQIQLFYTSKVLRYDPTFLTDRNLVIDGRGQAGVGFSLQMGRIYWKWGELQACNSNVPLTKSCTKVWRKTAE